MERVTVLVIYYEYFPIVPSGGEGGIRTHDRVASIVVFKTTALVRYATSPCAEEVGFPSISSG